MSAENRMGDHVAYITDLSKVREHFPEWRQEYDMSGIVAEIVDHKLRALASPGEAVIHNRTRSAS